MNTNEDLWGKFIAAAKAKADEVSTGSPPTGSTQGLLKVQSASYAGSEQFSEHEKFQVLSVAIPFDWGITTGNKAPLEYWNFCNQIPEWSPVGTYSPTGDSLVSSYNSFLDNIKDKQNRSYTEALAAFDNTDYVRIYIDNSDNVLKSRIYEWSENPTDMSQKLRAGTLAIEQTISLCNNTQGYDYSKSLASGRSKIENNFFAVSGKIEQSLMSREKSLEEFCVSITFRNLSLVTVKPSKWFDSAFLKIAAMGPFDGNIVGFAEEAMGNQPYFFGGPKGILRAMVTGLIVGYQPCFELTANPGVSREVSDSIKRKGFSIGPFNFKGSNIRKSEKRTIKGCDTSDFGQIFAVYIRTLP